jgi:histone-lysine N-methyltransferase SETD2
VFWKKLDFEPAYEDPDTNVDVDAAVDELKQFLSKQRDKRGWIAKVQKIIMPGRSTAKEPKVQKNTRGRPPTKSQSKKTADAPRHSSFQETPEAATRDPHRHSSYMGREELDPGIPSDYQDFIGQINPILRPHVEHIQNVLSDGNCGYRALAVAMGRHEREWHNFRMELHSHGKAWADYYQYVFRLSVEEWNLKLEAINWGFISRCPPGYWMDMPIAGYLIANLYNVVVHYSSAGGASTIFPMDKTPEELVHHQCIALAHVNGNHFIMLRLAQDCPMPPPDYYWKKTVAPHLFRWVEIYASRIKAFEKEAENYKLPTEHVDID